ncbi:MAG: phosphatase PAP2 family protein [Paludibacteraceae bacterium]|nr:phosphatase PAP2 family protein [Paludibacteraceae bacterium]MBP5137163.1 phosphatase PAP2 family protein [Paludibacteraceae bacterium]
MKTFFRIFFTTYVILFVIMIVAMATHTKAELHLLLNSFHSEGLDTFFRYYTKMAEFPLYIIAGLALLFWKAGAAYIFAISEGASAIIVFIIKRICQIPRPVSYFEQLGMLDQLPLVEGVRMNRSLSFPSGHTSTFFTFFTIGALLLSLYYAKHKCSWQKLSLRYVVMATLIICPIIGSYSRIYLSQHFLQDCFAGSIIGVAVPLFFVCLFRAKGWFEKDWFNKSLFGKDAYFFRKCDKR